MTIIIQTHKTKNYILT